MASKDSKSLLKRDKRQVAVSVKNEFNTPQGKQHLMDLLKHILDDIEKGIEDDMADWCKYLISGGIDFADYSANVKQYDRARVCGLVWTANFIAFRCRTCGVSPCMSLCPDCFYDADHTGHDFNMFRSHAGGACDCGDENVMKSEGFCTKHGKRHDIPTIIPSELTDRATIVIPKLIVRFLHFLRQERAESLDPSASLEEGDPLINLLHELTSLGAVMRTIMSEALVDQELYNTEFVEVSSENPESSTNLLKKKCAENLEEFKRKLKPPNPIFLKVRVCPQDSNNHHLIKCSAQCMSNLINKPFDMLELKHKTCLEEILFWTVKYEFPEKITTWLLGLLPDDKFKEVFTESFVDHYSRISVIITNCSLNEQRQRVSNKVVHVSVQLFSNETFAVAMTEKHQLLTRMIISLYNMLYRSNLTPSQMTLQGYHSSVNSHLVMDCGKELIRDHGYWPLISDLTNILSHKQVSIIFMNHTVLLEIWFELLSFLQGMNLNERELLQHVEFETDTYYSSFSAEFEISCQPLWRILLHCDDKTTNAQLCLVLDKCNSALNSWFESVGISSEAVHQVSPYQVSFHLPLHRYFAAFLCTAVLHKAVALPTYLDDEFLKKLLLHPLKIQVAFYEIFANMWVRNGTQIKGQAMTYTQCHFCNSLVDLDLFLLQVCGCRLDPDYFIRTISTAFHINYTLLPVPTILHHVFSERKQESSMLSGFLTLLSMLLSIRTYSGQGSDSILRKEVVTLLCFSDRTYSQLCESIPDKSSTNNPQMTPDLKTDLEKVADFKAPGFNASGKLQQGMYSPKPIVWLHEFDPLHAMLRTVHRREYQSALDRYTEFVHVTNKFPNNATPWPPFRIPKKPDESYTDIYNILRCKTLLHHLFNILYKVVDKVKQHEAAGSNDSNVTEEAPLDLVVFLLTMIVTQNDEETNTYRKTGSVYDEWFPHTLLYDNLIHSIDIVKVLVPEVKVNMDTDETDDRGPDRWAILNTTDEPEQETAALSYRLRSFELVLPSMNAYIDNHIQSGVTHDNNPAPSISYKEMHVSIKESFVSILIKLHNKMSDKKGSYVPITIRGDTIDWENSVGSGPFFIGRLLDILSTNSHRCAAAVEKTYKELLPKSNNSDSALAARHKAAERAKKKAMAKMAKMQNRFQDDIKKSMSKEEFDKVMNADVSEQYQVVEQYECCICSSTMISTENRPIGMVSLIQSTNVLSFSRTAAAADQLPIAPDDPVLDEQVLYSTYYQRRKADLDRVLPDKDAARSVLGINKAAGLFVQSCGHYIHMDCYNAYSESVNSQTRSRQTLTTDEYYCPLCRQLANTWLPVLPTGSDTPILVSIPPNPVLKIQEITKRFQQTCTPLLNSEGTESHNKILQHFKSNLKEEHQSYLSSDDRKLQTEFLISILHSNVSYCLMYYQNGISIPSRKTAIAHLMASLTHHIKSDNVLEGVCVDKIQQLTCIEVNPNTKSQSSVVPVQDAVPLLLEDPELLLLELLVTAGPNLPQGYFDTIVSVIYNLNYIQAVIKLTLKFNQDERQSWLSRPTSSRPSLTRRPSERDLKPSLIQIIISKFQSLNLYPEDECTQFLELSVWSPLSVDSFIQSQCIHFLEFAAIIKQDLYDVPIPTRMQVSSRHSIQEMDNSEWFLSLCRYFDLIGSDVQMDGLDTFTDAALHWVNGDATSTVNSWLQKTWPNALLKEKETLRSMLREQPVWFTPKLLELPNQYDKIFQFYRTKKCESCQELPQSPSVCLVCGTFVCFKDVCCLPQSGVSHAKRCGSGTCVILDINASIIAIIRGPRATLWGSLYLDEHGEEDRDLKRGKPLYLCKERFRMLEEQWLAHNFDYVCKRWIFHADQL